MAANRLINAERYKYVNKLLGAVGQTPDVPSGIREALELLVQTRDAEGSRVIHIDFQHYASTVGTGGSTNVIGTTVPDGKVWILEGSYLSTDDTTPRQATLSILNNPGPGDATIATGKIGDATNPTMWQLASPRRIIMCNKQSLYGKVEAITAAKKLTVVSFGWEIEYGDYVNL